MAQRIELAGIVSKKGFGQRLDRALAEIFLDHSRSRIKKWILNRKVLVNNEIWNSPKERLLGGESIKIQAELEEEISFKAQNISLNILYEDEDILVINKPHNLVVHPGAGNPDGTILNALLYYYPPIANVPRAGIVHRLDKDTTGLMVIAKTISAWIQLVKLLRLRKIIREYEAIAMGHIMMNGAIVEPIGRHPTKRTRMSVHSMGKPATTYYRIVEHFRIHTRLRIRLKTGYTHQIRVHMAHINHPLIGDQIYGGRLRRLPKGASEVFITALRKFNRQALHAATLCFYHPITYVKMEFHAPIPTDMTDLLEIIRSDFEEFEEHK